MRSFAFPVVFLFFALPAPPARAGPEPASAKPGRTSFQNDLLPVLTKVGCNQGTCHGSESGKGGFKLSLRGFAPELDYRSICLDLFSRRVELARPEESLLLRKPTLAVPHQGGRVLPPGSSGYRIVLQWLSEGAPGPREDEPLAAGLTIESLERGSATLERGARLALRITAGFKDGNRRDVTEWARYDSSDATVAAVDREGRVEAVGPGIAALTASWRDQVQSVEVLVPYPVSVAIGDYSALPRTNLVDDFLIARWKELRLWPSPPAGDAVFLRRITLDLTGRLPSPEEARAFLADPSPTKRDRVIDRLLWSPLFADHWTQRWGDVFRVSREWLGEKAVWQFHRWLRDRIARNVPWNEVVGELVAGAGNSEREGPPNFYRLQKVFNEPELWPLVAAETTAQTFLGVRMQCARCHNHPFDRWTQADYYGWASFFAQVGSKVLPGNQVVIYDGSSGEINHPRLGRPLPPRPLAAEPLGPEPGLCRRERLARWITSPENPFFARATANRIWRHLMGRGLVEPLDDLRPSNPPTHGALLEALARELAGHGFDTRHLLRLILRSRAYQLSSTPTAGNLADYRFYSRWQPRRLAAEELLDALGQVTGLGESFPGLPAGFRAQELPDTRVASVFLDGFGRPLRRVASCECERVQDPNLGQALELMNSPALEDRLRGEGSLAGRLVAGSGSDSAVLEEVYLAALSRPPLAAEAAAVLAARGGAAADAGERRKFFEDVLWAVINSKEFLFNH